MKQRPPDSDDATSEEEAPEFDGTATIQLDDTYRVRLAADSENAGGAASFAAGASRKETTDRLRVLESPALDMATSGPLAESDDDADATGVFVKPTID